MPIKIKFRRYDTNYNIFDSFEEVTKLKKYDFIKEIDCSKNQLYELPNLPKRLQKLDCSFNFLKSLPELPNTLISIECESNYITDLPRISKNLLYVNHFNNPIFYIIENSFDGKTKKYLEWKLKIDKIFISKIENWFLDCKYNPKYKYCRDWLNESYDKLLSEKLQSVL